MKTSRIANFKAGVAPLVLGIALLSTPVMAQDATADEDAAPAEEEILVTGSRIQIPNLVSAAPVAVVTGEEFFQTGSLSVGDLLNDLPQLRSTFSQQNSTRFLGTRGLSLLDLRGLGTQRTLVLVNGRRHVAADVLNNATSPDTNTFPTDLIERVDVLTGGASAVYGSDAIAGVVNFVLKTDYEGIQVRAQSGISRYGDAGNQYVSALAGTNFADGRGNIAVNLEFAHTSRYFGSGRPNLRQNNGFLVVDTDPAGTPNGSDGQFDRIFFRDLRSATISQGGQVTVFQGTNPLCGVSSNGSPFTCNFLFQPDGSLVAQTGLRVGIGPGGAFIGGNGETGREAELLTLTPDLKRYSANLLAHFEFSPAAELFLEAKYVRSDAFGTQSGPFFAQGATNGDPGGRERIRLDNPYLGAAARTLLTQQLLATTVNANTGATLTAAQLATQRAAINAGTFRLGVRRRWVDFGNRDEQFRRETYRAVVGLRGEFNDDWKYEIAANYGEHRESSTITGNVNVQRYLLGVDATTDANGNIVCRSQLNPAGTISYVTGNPLSVGDDPFLAADIAACVPINPFGQGSLTSAARNYALVNSFATGKITQLDITANVSGDLSQLFELPGGPIAFSIGGEYRREKNFYTLDNLTQLGYAFYNAIPSFTAPAFEVKELAGEIYIPLLKDVTLFEDLSIRASGRVSDYSGSTGTVYAYGAEGIWKPIQDITLRGSYSRSVRAPNLSELFTAATQNFAPGFVDPCSANNIGTGSATRAANCAAAGAPAGYNFVYSSSLQIVSVGNPNLTEETSDSYTLGALLQPRFLPGFSISADYYNIKVKNVITTVSAQNTANLCYDSPTLNNPFCPLFTRNTAPVGPAGEIPFQILEGSLFQLTRNFAKLQVTGVDVNMNYSHRYGFGTVNLSSTYTHVIKNNSFTNPQTPTFVNVLNEELGDPQDAVNFNASVKFNNRITLGYQLRWLAGQFLNTFEDYNGVNGQPPQNADFAEIRKYPDVWYHDMRVAYDVNDEFNIYAGIDNITNRQPPFGLTGVGGGSGIYDVRGRYFYAGISAKF